jgi:hypothetical protein
MAEARAGNVEAVAIVSVSPDGIPEPSFGGEAELMPCCNIGLDMLKVSLVTRCMQTVEKPTTSIVRPVNGG